MALDYTDDLRLAHVLADDADALSTSRYKALDLHVMTKPDLTPVTDADQTVEEGIRRTLSRARPRDAVYGEEQGTTGHGQRCWVVDPIDGTKNFVRGVPVWATLLALSDGDRMVVGVVSAPALGKRWWAARGSGSWTSDPDGSVRPCRVSQVAQLGDAFLSYSSAADWQDGFDRLLSGVWRTRAFGDFWSHVLVAEGAVDLSGEPEVSLWDVAPLQVIVEEAGGRYTDLGGQARTDTGSILCSNGLLHDAALALLQAR